MRKPLSLLAALLLIILFAVAVQAAPVEITAPPDGSVVNGESVDIIVNINSTDQAPVSRVEVSLDGKSVTERVYTPAVAGGNSVFRWNTVRTPNGKHTLGVGVFSGGNVVGNASCEITVSNKDADHKAPKVVIRSPKDGQVISGTTAIIVESTDDSGADPFVSIYVDKGIRSASNVRPYKYDWNTVSVENGPHYISAKATDDSDNTISTPTIRVIVRNPVLRVPVAARSQGKLPDLADMGVSTETLASTKTNSTSTPGAASSSVNMLEASRNAAQTLASTDKFEVSQTKAEKSTSSTVKVSAKLPAMPTPVSLSAASSSKSSTVASTSLEVSATHAVAKTSAVALPQGSVASSASAPTLIASNVESAAGTSALSDNLLSVPATPKVTSAESLMPKSESSSSPVQTPTLTASTVSLNAAPSVVTEARLSAPALPQEHVFPVSATSKTSETPVLVSAHMESVSTVGTTDSRLTAPVVPTIKIPAAKGTLGVQLSAPILVAKLDSVDVAASAKANVLSTPNAPKAKKNVKSVAKVAAPVKTVTAPKATSAKAVVVASKTVAEPVGETKTTQKPVVHKAKGVKMVWIRPAFENAGGTVDWNRKSKTVNASAKQKVVSVKIGSKTAHVNSQPVTMDRAAALRSGRTVVPESFVKGTLGVSTK